MYVNAHDQTKYFFTYNYHENNRKNLTKNQTGFMENKWPQLIKGDVRSVYSSMLQMNLCNHRDYQNIAVNGASSGNILGIAKSISRNQKLDYPVILNFALIGNDVCNGSVLINFILLFV